MKHTPLVSGSSETQRLFAFAAAIERSKAVHAHERDGERLRRLMDGHGHAERTFLERVWRPSVGSFDWLHPEYEVSDFKDGYRYLGFAYIRFPYRIGIEIDGYGPHLRDVSRTHFADQPDMQTAPKEAFRAA